MFSRLKIYFPLHVLVCVTSASLISSSLCIFNISILVFLLDSFLRFPFLCEITCLISHSVHLFHWSFYCINHVLNSLSGCPKCISYVSLALIALSCQVIRLWLPLACFIIFFGKLCIVCSWGKYLIRFYIFHCKFPSSPLGCGFVLIYSGILLCLMFIIAMVTGIDIHCCHGNQLQASNFLSNTLFLVSLLGCEFSLCAVSQRAFVSCRPPSYIPLLFLFSLEPWGGWEEFCDVLMKPLYALGEQGSGGMAFRRLHLSPLFVFPQTAVATLQCHKAKVFFPFPTFCCCIVRLLLL
jgi:hypothetical protein